LLRAGSLAAEAALAFREQRLRRLELQIETEIARSDPRNVAILCELQRPVLDPDMRVAFVGAGETQPRARRTLVVTQAATSRVGECRMREDDLLRRERARILFLDAGASAKERDLNAEIVAVRILDPARDVPPFRAEGRVAAVIARERELQTGFDIWILGRCRSGERECGQCENEATPACPLGREEGEGRRVRLTLPSPAPTGERVISVWGFGSSPFPLSLASSPRHP